MCKNFPLNLSIDDASIFTLVYSINSHKQEGKELKERKELYPL